MSDELHDEMTKEATPEMTQMFAEKRELYTANLKKQYPDANTVIVSITSTDMSIMLDSVPVTMRIGYDVASDETKLNKAYIKLCEYLADAKAEYDAEKAEYSANVKSQCKSK